MQSYQMHSKTCVKRPLSKRPKIGFQDRLSLNAGQKYCRILQYFRPSLSLHLSLRSLFCLFLSGRFNFYTDFTVNISQLSEVQMKTRQMLVLIAKLQKQRQILETLRNEDKAIWEQKVIEIEKVKVSAPYNYM